MSAKHLEGRVRGPAAVLAILLIPMAATAGNWQLKDSLTARVTAVDKTGDNPESGLVFQVAPGIRLNGEGARGSADLSYRLTASSGTNTTDPDRLTHNLLARGELEAIEDFFYLGGNASARLVGNTAGTGPVDAINAGSEGSQTYSVQLTPQFRRRLGRYATFVSNNSIDYVTYDREQDVTGDDSYSTTLNLGLRSGPYYAPFDWALDATHKETDYDDRTDTRSFYTAGAGYRLSPRWRINGTVGYEENDVLTTRDETDGTIWSVGADWTPNPRTSVSAEYGERYLGSVYSVTARHETRRTLFSMDLSKDISNRRTQELVDSFFILTDGAGNIVIDPNTGNPIIVNAPFQQQVDEDYVNTQLRAALRVTGLRTAVTLTATASQRDYEVSGTDEDTRGLSLSISRQLGGDYNATLNTVYTHSEGSDQGDSDTYDVRLSLGKRLSPRTRASVDFLHRERDATDDYTENRIGVSLTTNFL